MRTGMGMLALVAAVAVAVAAGCGGSGGSATPGELQRMDVALEGVATADGVEASDGVVAGEGVEDGLAADVACVPGPTALGFTDNCTGTLQDQVTNLLWTKDFFNGTVKQGSDYCKGQPAPTGLTGSWALPDVDQLRALVRGCDSTVTGGTCAVSKACWNMNQTNCFDPTSAFGPCGGCDLKKGPGAKCYEDAAFENSCGNYWTATKASDSMNWQVSFDVGSIEPQDATETAYVRCVFVPSAS